MRKYIVIVSSTIIFIISSFTSIFFLFPPRLKAVSEVIISPLAQEISNNNILNQVQITPQFKDNKVNILLLGLDGRKNQKSSRCDAIHLITLDFLNEKIKITSIPRGTEIKLAKTEGNYLSNLCSIYGIEKTIPFIAKLTGINPDYTIKIGFSQILGILRHIGFPANSALQFLRNRAYPLGDYQRSYNQANFLKDLIVSHLDKLASIPQPVQYLIFRTLDTDLPYEKASQILNRLLSLGFLKKQNNIKINLVSANATKVKEIHLTQNSSIVKTDDEFQQYQRDFINYLNNLIMRVDQLIQSNNLTFANKTIGDAFNKKLWLQIENEKRRQQFYYEILKRYVLTAENKEGILTPIFDFLTDMKESDNSEFYSRGEELLKTVSA